jgi:protein-disulfide isomerase
MHPTRGIPTRRAILNSDVAYAMFVVRSLRSKRNMGINLGISVKMALLGLLVAQSVWAQSGNDMQALSKEIEALKAGQAAMQKDLQEIKSLLQQAAPAARTPPGPPAPEPVNVVLDVEGSPVKGDKAAKLTLVEFTDYQCPFCSRYLRQTWPQLERDYVKTGKMKLVLRDMPLESIHPLAFKAAEATHCAGKQGKFWEMHDLLFANQNALARKDLSTHAQTLALDVAAFDQCMDSNSTAPRIRTDLADSEKAGARGTPTFYLGLTDANGTQVKAVRIIRGAQSYASFKDAIENLLASAK